MRKSSMKLRFGKVRGQRRLAQAEEQTMADKGEDWVAKELLKLMTEMLGMNIVEAYRFSTALRLRLNSLIWVYFELAGQPRIIKNLHILNAWAGLGTINKLANKANFNASFVSRLFLMKCGGGWTFDQVMRLSSALGIDPRVLLFSDLGQLIGEQEKLYQK